LNYRCEVKANFGCRQKQENKSWELIQKREFVVKRNRMTAEEFKNRMLPFTRKLYPMMKRLLGGEEETKDALQDLMLKLWTKREYLRNCSNPEGYIFTAAKNHCFDLKKKSRFSSGHVSCDALIQLADTGTDPDAGEKLENVHKIMLQLPENYQEVLQMREIDGFSYEEIELLTGHGIPYIRVILSRARIKLKEELNKIYDYERGTCQPA